MLDSWVLTFNEFLYKIPYETIEKETVSTILGLSERSQHMLSKYIAARMIGFVANVSYEIFSSSNWIDFIIYRDWDRGLVGRFLIELWNYAKISMLK